MNATCILPHWPKGRYFELEPLNFAAAPTRLDAVELGTLTVPLPL